MFTVTTNDVPGYRITRVLGEVMGQTVRATSYGQNFSSGYHALAGGEVPEFTRVMYESRYEAAGRMWAEAVQRGANAVVATRYDTGSIADFFQVAAYGTAVVVEPIGQSPSAQAVPAQAVPAQHPAQPATPPPAPRPRQAVNLAPPVQPAPPA